MSKELAVREPPPNPATRYPEPETDRIFWSVRDVAKHLGIGEKAVRREVRSGRMRCWVISGAWRFRRAWVDEWLEKGPQEQVDFSAKRPRRPRKKRGRK